jgi:methylase of polypeptide subunit release factors
VGLLRPAAKNPALLVCPVWLYPVEDFVLASDRCNDPDGGLLTPPADVVFPAIYAGTLRFLELLPEAPGAEALDLCGGSGIGALHLSHTARVCVTSDLTERSTLFAEFNARLNGVRIESLCGDLYAPVNGRCFDLISAHPPFVPTIGDTMIYRDAGETGETVTRRIIEGLPGHLRLGGTAVIVCVACDRECVKFEQSVQEWLGDARDEFDIVFGLERILQVGEVVGALCKQGQQFGDDAERELYSRIKRARIQQFVYGALFLRRHAQRPGNEPTRVSLTPAGRAADFERLLAWQKLRCRPDLFEWLAASRPQLPPRLMLTVRHLVKDGELVPEDFVFSIEDGFAAALRPDAWIVPLLARLNGRHTVWEVFEAAQEADELPKGFSLEPFLGLVRRMIDLGLLAVPTQTI